MTVALKPVELQVLQAIANGETTSEIAQRLIRSTPTIKKYRSRVLARLRANNAPHAVAIAYQHGLLGEAKPRFEPATAGQIGKVYATAQRTEQALGIAHGDARHEVLEEASAKFGRTIASVDELGRLEASWVIDRLQEMGA